VTALPARGRSVPRPGGPGQPLARNSVAGEETGQLRGRRPAGRAGGISRPDSEIPDAAARASGWIQALPIPAKSGFPISKVPESRDPDQTGVPDFPNPDGRVHDEKSELGFRSDVAPKGGTQHFWTTSPKMDH
jgi:hypothetical protein